MKYEMFEKTLPSGLTMFWGKTETKTSRVYEEPTIDVVSPEARQQAYEQRVRAKAFITSDLKKEAIS